MARVCITRARAREENALSERKEPSQPVLPPAPLPTRLLHTFSNAIRCVGCPSRRFSKVPARSGGRSCQMQFDDGEQAGMVKTRARHGDLLSRDLRLARSSPGASSRPLSLVVTIAGGTLRCREKTLETRRLLRLRTDTFLMLAGNAVKRDGRVAARSSSRRTALFYAACG